MGVDISDYVDVRERCSVLGFDSSPRSLTFLPRNFDSAPSRQELLYEGSLPTVRVLCRQAGLEAGKIEPPHEQIPHVAEEGFYGWVGPTLLVSYAYYTQNPDIINVALSVIAGYLADWFKGITGEKRVKLDIVVESRKGGFKRIHYEGTPEEMPRVAEVVSEVFRDG